MKSLVLIVGLIILVLAVSAGFFPSQNKAKQALANAGYSNIHLRHSYHFFASLRGCSHDDVTKFVYSAKNPLHKLVTVSVCAGWPFKGDTIRY